MPKISYFFIRLIKLYQHTLSPMMHNRCRFFPTCSHYGIEAIETWGTVKGLLLTMRRILKCHPFGKSGIDFVPQKDLKDISTSNPKVGIKK